jgi:hypothetical protein
MSPADCVFYAAIWTLFNIRLKNLHKYLDVDVVVIASECIFHGQAVQAMSGIIDLTRLNHPHDCGTAVDRGGVSESREGLLCPIKPAGLCLYFLAEIVFLPRIKGIE